MILGNQKNQQPHSWLGMQQEGETDSIHSLIRLKSRNSLLLATFQLDFICRKSRELGGSGCFLRKEKETWQVNGTEEVYSRRRMNGNHPFLAQIVFPVYLKGCFSRCQNVRSIYLIRTKIPRMYRQGSLNFKVIELLGILMITMDPFSRKHMQTDVHIFIDDFRGSQSL